MQRLERYPARVRLGTALLILFACMTMARAVQNASLQRRENDDPSRAIERYSALKAQLPEARVVGYVSDRGTPGIDSVQSKAAWKFYVLAQYALAPVLVLEDGKDQGRRIEYVVGDFKDPSAVAAAAHGGALVLIRDFGNGVALFHRGAR